MDDIPDFGDLDGLARRVRQAIAAIEVMDSPDDQRTTWIAEFEAACEGAKAAELKSEEGLLEPGAARPTRGYLWGYVA